MTGGELSAEQIDEITEDDMAYWLGNKFMSPDLLVEKVCWWVNAVVAARVAAVEADRNEAQAALTDHINLSDEAYAARIGVAKARSEELERDNEWLTMRANEEREAKLNNLAGWRKADAKIAAAERRAEKAEALVEAGLALHLPDPSGQWCDHCWTGPSNYSNGPSPEWPCATVRALGGAS